MSRASARNATAAVPLGRGVSGPSLMVRRSGAVLVVLALAVALFAVGRGSDARRRRPEPRSCAIRTMLSTSHPRRPKVREPARALALPAARIVARAPPVRAAPERPPETDDLAAPAPGSCAREVDKCAEGSVGSATACFNLGRMYESGECGEKDPLAATRAFGRGCDLGDRSACRVAGRVEPARGAADDPTLGAPTFATAGP